MSGVPYISFFEIDDGDAIGIRQYDNDGTITAEILMESDCAIQLAIRILNQLLLIPDNAHDTA